MAEALSENHQILLPHLIWTALSTVFVLLAVLLYDGRYGRRSVALVIIVVSILTFNVITLIDGVLSYIWRPAYPPAEVPKETRVCLGCRATIDKKSK